MSWPYCRRAMPGPVRRWMFLIYVFGIVACTVAVSVADDSAPSSSTPPEWKAPARAAKRKNPIAADANSIAAGTTVYTQQCLACHGATGKGDGKQAPQLQVKPKDLSDPAVAGQTDGALFWKITTGLKPMPTFEKLISEDDRWNVINYIRTFAPAPTSQPSQGGN